MHFNKDDHEYVHQSNFLWFNFCHSVIFMAVICQKGSWISRVVSWGQYFTVKHCHDFWDFQWNNHISCWEWCCWLSRFNPNYFSNWSDFWYSSYAWWCIFVSSFKFTSLFQVPSSIFMLYCYIHLFVKKINRNKRSWGPFTWHSLGLTYMYSPLMKLLAQWARSGRTHSGSGNHAEKYSSISATNQHQINSKMYPWNLQSFFVWMEFHFVQNLAN